MSDEWRYDPESGSFRRSGGMQPKKDNSWISWGLIILGFVIWWPIGLGLLVAKLKDEPSRKTANRHYNTGASAPLSHSAVRRTGPGTAPAGQRDGGEYREHKERERKENRVAQAAKEVTRSPSGTGRSAKALKIAGAIAAGLFGLFAITELADILGGTGALSDALEYAGITAGGVLMFLSGRRMQKRQGRIAAYAALMGDRDFITVEELVNVTGKKRGVVEKDIEYMVQKSMMGTGAFLDEGRGVLFRSADAYQRYLSERTRTEDLTPKEANEGYAGALRAIREANDRIPDPVFSEKLDHMEEIAGRIFREVEAHPEKQKQASTFFDYYLPTTLKLLGTYTEFDAAGIEGENLRSAKQRIESIMDNLLESFERQLDELYRSEAMDVDADIRVMENMLARDLSSVERDFGLGGAAQQRAPR